MLSYFLRWIPAVAVAALIFALSSQQTLPRPPGLSPNAQAIAGHFMIYAMLTVAIWFALPGHVLADRWRFGLVVLAAVTYGALDEWHQSFVPGRHSSLVDLLVDAAGVVFALTLLWMVDRRYHERRRSLKQAEHRE